MSRARRQWLAAGLVCAIVLGIVAALTVIPARGELAEQTARRDRAAQPAPASLDPMAALPARFDRAGTEAHLRTLARGAGVTIQAITPAPARGQGALRAHPLRVRANGTLAQLAGFAQAVSSDVRADAQGRAVGAPGALLMSVDQVSYAAGAGGAGSATLLISAYTRAPALR